MAIERKVAIVTGANSGVGYSIVQRLVDESPFPLTIILACRNKARAQEALTSLQLHFTSSSNSSSKTRTTPFHAPELKIELVDVGSATSVLAFNARILAQHSRVDFLFCNAGILPSAGLMWGKILTDMFKAPMDLVTRSDVLVQPKQYLTEGGVGNVLACNVFGHYLMIKGLEDVLSRTEEDPGRVIWTSSMTAEKASFRMDDWQGLEAVQPYESSKWVTDLLAIRLNEEWAGSSDEDMASVHSVGGDASLVASSSGSETSGTSTPTRRVTRSTSKSALTSNPTTTTPKKHIISLSTQPGVVASGIGGLAAWIVLLRIALHYAVRLMGERNQTITGHHGAQSNVYVALKQPVGKLDYRNKYGSCVKNFGQEFLKVERVVEYERGQAEIVVGRLEALRQGVLARKE
ncbi:NAD(P)-binding protein [Linnemannia elongata AG-77]|uniref:3beta-hydroxysteroid 3-dehydrogenase n=1 Tax=Linnemannia elongata AG-77 TaxID=1314771 RepID=A0A197JFX1_9FUNG|nr:NAD(P)-binding protein [Linnemannia elongata AG-77]